MTVVNIKNDTEFKNHLASTEKLVIVDFTASWCGPCLRIAPFYKQLSEKFPQGLFLKVDINVCENTAMAHGVTSMPTFMFFKNNTKIDCFSGADTKLLEEKVKQYCAGDGGDEVAEVPVKGQMDLRPFMMKTDVEALNEASEHPLTNCFQDNDEYLQSDCDNQLIIPITFSQAVKIHSIKIKAPENSGPKTVKIFINQPSTLDFDKAVKNDPAQSISVQPTDLASGKPIGLQFVKFQNVQNMQIFVQDNHNGSDVTRIDYLQLFGSPIHTTNMTEFKRVSGKKGESEN